MQRIQTTTDCYIRPSEAGDYGEFWRILRKYDKNYFWGDSDYHANKTEFIRWFDRSALYSVTAVDSRKIVGGAFVHQVAEPFYASINIFKRKGYKNHRIVTEICRSGLKYWFDLLDIEKLIGVTPVQHKACIRLAKSVGFRKEGTLRHYNRINGVWTDYIQLSLLKEEACSLSEKSGISLWISLFRSRFAL